MTPVGTVKLCDCCGAEFVERNHNGLTVYCPDCRTPGHREARRALTNGTLQCSECKTVLRVAVPSGMCGFCEIEDAQVAA